MKLFDLGTVEISDAAKDALETNKLISEDFLSRHQQGDWGDLDEFSLQKNDAGIQDHLLVTSRYILENGSELFVSTAGDRSQTHLFLEADRTFEEVDTQTGYAIWAPTYDRGRNPLIEVEEPRVMDLIEGLGISTVLDAGTGTGRYALKFARLGADVSAIDQSKEMLAAAQEKASAQGLKIDFQLCSVEEDLPFQEKNFELVICALMLSHIADLSQVVRNFHHVLQNDGHLLISAYHPDIIKHGWRTIFDRPKKMYGLPNVSRSRAEYLVGLKTNGFDITNVIDVPVRNVPAGIFPEAVFEEAGDINFCLIILAKKIEI